MRPARPAVLALVALLVCGLAGCVRLDRGISLNADGSGAYRVAVGFSDRLVQAGGTSFASQMDACASKVKAEGGASTRADDGSYTTWTFTWRFADIDTLNALLKRGTTFCQAPGATGVAAAASVDPVEVTERARLLTTTFVVRGHVSLIVPQDTVDLQNPDTSALFKDARTSFSVAMPLWVTSYMPGGAVNGSTITYTTHVGESKDFEVVGGGLTTLGILAALGGLAAVLIALLALFVIVRLVRRRRRGTVREPAHSAKTAAHAAE
jgi:hypothetical protein